jgi:FkbM family methyltransferase
MGESVLHCPEVAGPARRDEGAGPDSPRPAPRWVRLAAGLVRRLPAGRYRLTHWLGRRPGPPFLATTPAAVGGFSFVCDLRDSIAREVCFTGQYEPQETALLRQLLGPGQTFVDVGANWGYFTFLAAALTGPAGRIVSLEPDPRLFALLQANLRHNGLGRVTALPVAAADRADTLRLAGFDAAGGNWGQSRLANADAAASFLVPTTLLDAALDRLGVVAIDVLKMDIEGAEDLALRGMADGLSRHRYRHVLLEVHPALLAERGRTFEQTVAPLTAAGYRPWRIDHSPAATRRAAYRPATRLADLLTPTAAGEPLDLWPHLLWVSPEAKPPVAGTRPLS